MASRETAFDAWRAALAGDPVAAFGGIIATNCSIDQAIAEDIDKIFYEVLMAPDFTSEALELLSKKKGRIILKMRPIAIPPRQFRSLLGGVLEQERDSVTEGNHEMKVVTQHLPNQNKMEDMIFANKLVKHTKSNAIVLVKNKQLIGSGTGQTSRIEALHHAVQRAKQFNHEVFDCVLASDAFFPFSDSVEMAYREGIRTIIQPGGSIKDQDSIDFCNTHGLSMVFTGFRHFKH
jgi:phosphoribosylaminoimidazolecarboxamide formyltransferase/IMP cyclohydrolase